MTAGAADPAEAVRATERWFYAHGLPYFVVRDQQAVHEALGRRRLTALAGVALLLAAAVGVGVGLLSGDVSAGVLAGVLAVGAVLVGYALMRLRAWPIVTWALRRTLGSLRLLFPLVTRALPLLLLFITFLFINTEVWQVTSSMDGAVLWMVVLLFGALALGFLLVRLPEEVDRVSGDADRSRLGEHVRGTPVAQAVHELDPAATESPEAGRLHGLQRANLLLVLLFAQATQVLVLSFSVFVFFVGFGRLAITPGVIRSWTGQEADPFGLSLLGSVQLYQVSVFLAAFAGLYFTVYAVTDQLYRDQFFTHVSHELERAVGVRTAYLELRRHDDGGPGAH